MHIALSLAAKRSSVYRSSSALLLRRIQVFVASLLAARPYNLGLLLSVSRFLRRCSSVDLVCSASRTLSFCRLRPKRTRSLCIPVSFFWCFSLFRCLLSCCSRQNSLGLLLFQCLGFFALWSLAPKSFVLQYLSF